MLQVKSKFSASLYCAYLIHSAKAKNREHAKNTRIRKKHYIEALKESLKLLSEERDKIDRDRRNSLSRLAEQVMEDKTYYYHFRGRKYHLQYHENVIHR